MTDSTFEMRPKLPVFAVTKQSFSFLVTQWRLMGLPFIALLLVNLLTSHLSFQYLATRNLRMSEVVSFVLLLVEASFIVGVHRAILLDEKRTGITFYRLDGNWLRYVVTWFLLGLIFIAMMVVCGILFSMGLGFGLPGDTLKQVLHVPPAQMLAFLIAGTLDHGHPVVFVIMSALCLAVVVIVIFLCSRLALSLPAAALGQSKSIRLSWRLARGNVWRIFAICLLTTWLPFVIGMPSMPSGYLAQHVSQPWLSVISEGWNALIQSISVVAWATALSLSYQALGGALRRPAAP